MVLTKKMGDQTLLASPRQFKTTADALEEVQRIVGDGAIEINDKEITVYPFMKESVTFRLAPATEWLK